MEWPSIRGFRSHYEYPPYPVVFPHGPEPRYSSLQYVTDSRRHNHGHRGRNHGHRGHNNGHRGHNHGHRDDQFYRRMEQLEQLEETGHHYEDRGTESETDNNTERSPSGLSFGLSFGFFDPYEKPQDSPAPTSWTSPHRGKVKGSKSIVGEDPQKFNEYIFNVLSSRYRTSSDFGQRCEAKLVLQPPAGESERSLHPLLNWM